MSLNIFIAMVSNFSIKFLIIFISILLTFIIEKSCFHALQIKYNNIEIELNQIALYLPKRKNPSVTPFQNPSVGFQSKIKNQARSAALRAASVAMSICANLIKSSDYYSPLNCRKYKTHDISIITMTLENPLKYMNQRCRKHFECGGVLYNKIWCSHKIRVVTKSVLLRNTVYSIVPTQVNKNSRYII